MPGHEERGAEEILLEKVLRRDKVVKCSVLREMELTAEKMLKQEAVRNRVMRLDAEQQVFVACLQSGMDCYKGQSVPFVVLQSSLRGTEVIKRVYLAAVSVVGEGSGLNSREISVTEKSRDGGCSVTQYIKRAFDLRMSTYAASLKFFLGGVSGSVEGGCSGVYTKHY